ncbi:uncharacterized protein METZ01_LOCUS289889, partial [marine metagenome]
SPRSAGLRSIAARWDPCHCTKAAG